MKSLFGYFNYFIRSVVNKNINEQELLDLAHAAIFVKGREWCLQYPGQTPTEKDIDEFSLFVDELHRNSTLKNYVQNNLNSQTIKIFETIDEIKYDTRLIEEKHLVDKIGYTVECKESKIKNAGNGLFIKSGKANAGQIIAYFPGLVHLFEHFKQGYLETLLPDDDYMLISRYDGTVIDSRHAEEMPYNPYGLGHCVNHVPPSVQPNALQLCYDFPDDPFMIESFPPRLQKYIPNRLAKPRTFLGTIDRSIYMPTKLLVASRTIQTGEEILMDYRLNPNFKPFPSWYSPYDIEAVNRRLK